MMMECGERDLTKGRRSGVEARLALDPSWTESEKAREALTCVHLSWVSDRSKSAGLDVEAAATS